MPFQPHRQWTNEEDGAPADQPSFLPMFPWYSGTSADLLKTALDLVVSVKLFLGRFDMRAMHASLAGHGTEGGAASAPHAGDGYLFDHCSSAKEVWFDFTADTGDGGDPTYAVARMMAAPQLTVAVPEDWLRRGGAKTVWDLHCRTINRAQHTLPSSPTPSSVPNTRCLHHQHTHTGRSRGRLPSPFCPDPSTGTFPHPRR